MNKRFNVIISGAQGYVGQELKALTLCHPYLNLIGIHSRQTKDKIEKTLHFNDQSLPVYTTDDILEHASQIDILFLATPAAVSMELVAKLANTKIILIDLSGAFRLSEQTFNEWYALPHSAPQFIKEACYGLSPWITPNVNHRLVANPGCYATCALMAIIPLLKAKLIKANTIIIDAKSGVSGGGKQAKSELMFCEIANNFFPYKIGTHQHTPEIKKGLYEITNCDTNIRLTTSILPVIRGISMTIYVEADSSFSSDDAISTAIYAAMQTDYQNYPLLHFQELGKASSYQDHFILSLKNVVQTPNTHIGYFVKDGQITLFSCIDNLLKGAASQAIENINAIYNLPLQTGLLAVKEAS